MAAAEQPPSTYRYGEETMPITMLATPWLWTRIPDSALMASAATPYSSPVPMPKLTAAAGARWPRGRLRSGLAATSKPTTTEGIMTAAIEPGLA